ncbi:RIP metalloprotease RseP, partial [Erysipelatoclostridium ramosum]
NDVVEFIQYYNGDTEFTVLRDGKQVMLHFTPTYVKDESKYILGVLQQNEIKEISLLESIPYGTEKMVDSVTTIFESLGKLVQGVGLK